MGGEIEPVMVLAQADTAAPTDAQGAADASAGSGVHEGTVAGEVHEKSAFPPFDATTFASQLLWLALSFGALYLVMSRFALPRIGEILEVRRDRIEGDLAEAERLRQRTDQAIESYEEALAEARRKAHGIAEQTRGEIRADIDAKRATVEQDLAARMTEAEARIEKTKAGALANVEEIATDTATTLVSQLLGRVPAKSIKDAVKTVVKER